MFCSCKLYANVVSYGFLAARNEMGQGYMLFCLPMNALHVEQTAPAVAFDEHANLKNS